MNNALSKRFRYTLGQNTENLVISLMESLIYAKNSPIPIKSSYLIKAQAALEILALNLRMLLELKLVNETQAFQIQSKFQEVGRMIGGWKKSL